MATINATLSTNEFIKLYGDGQWVRDFSPEGIEAILSEIEESQGSEVLDWTASFMSASEVDYKTFFDEQLEKFDIDDLSNDITDALDYLVEVDDENTDDIFVKSENADSRTAYDIHEIFKMFKDTLLENDDFKDIVFDFVNDQKDHIMTKLDNGKILLF